jgi:hypothetical protein
MDVLGANRFRRVVCSKQSCGFSTQARNGTCCRRATRTTKLCIGATKSLKRLTHGNRISLGQQAPSFIHNSRHLLFGDERNAFIGERGWVFRESMMGQRARERRS